MGKQQWIEPVPEVLGEAKYVKPGDSETTRVAKIKAAAVVPDACGPVIQSAPGRGAFIMFTPRAFYPDGADGWAVKDAGHQGRKAIRTADVFDVMASKAARAPGRRAGPPFSAKQVDTARRYRELVEFEAKGNLKCSSLDGRVGATGGEDPVDRRMRVLQELERMRARVAHTWALSAQRAAPHRDRRQPIPLRAALDLLCVEDLPLSSILQRYGWSVKGAHIEALRDSLRQALNRMAL